MEKYSLFLENQIQPIAEQLDSDPQLLLRAFRLLGERGELALAAEGASREEMDLYAEWATSYSGALGFFQRQHQAAVKMLVDGENVALRDQLVPRMKYGEVSSGVAIGFLRRQPPTLIAERRGKDLLLNGRAPWVSGKGLLQHLVVGFVLPDEELEGYGWIPFTSSKTLVIGEAIETIALTSVQTTELHFHQHRIDEDHLIQLAPRGSYNQKGPAFQRHFLSLLALARSLQRLFPSSKREAQVQSMKEAMQDEPNPSCYYELSKLLNESLYEALLELGSKAVLASQPLGRLIRELAFFTAVGLPPRVSQTSK